MYVMGRVLETLERVRVEAWNKRHPVGTLVKAVTKEGGSLQTRTRTEAYMVGPLAAIGLEGDDRPFLVSHVEAISEEVQA